jgi:hypothetical protein
VSTGSGPANAGDRPVLRIVRGSPSGEETAALLAVLAAAGPDAAEPVTSVVPEGQWAQPVRLLRESVGTGGWWEFGLPR